MESRLLSGYRVSWVGTQRTGGGFRDLLFSTWGDDPYYEYIFWQTG